MIEKNGRTIPNKIILATIPTFMSNKSNLFFQNLIFRKNKIPITMRSKYPIIIFQLVGNVVVYGLLRGLST